MASRKGEKLKAEGKAAVTEDTIKIALPKDKAVAMELYKDSLTKVKNLESKLLTMPYEPRESFDEGTRGYDIKDKQAELARWQGIVDRIEKEKPEIVFDAGVETYKTGGGQLVKDRAAWVAE